MITVPYTSSNSRCRWNSPYDQYESVEDALKHITPAQLIALANHEWRVQQLVTRKQEVYAKLADGDWSDFL